MNRSNRAKNTSTSNTEDRRKKAVSVVEVIPLTRGGIRHTLSYFTTQDIAPGNFIKVPVQKKLVAAIVSSVTSAKHSKTDLKQKSFSLKSLGKQPGVAKTPVSIPEPFLLATQQTSDFYASSMGAVLNTLLPKFILDERETLWKTHTKPKKDSKRAKSRLPEPKSEVLLIQLETEERFGQYRSIIRESLAKKSSVMVVVPTEEEALRVFHALSRGIEEYAHLFTLKQKAKELKDTLKKVRASEHAILLVCTPAGLAIDRPDLNTIILERESSRAYRTLSRPFIHFRTFLQFYTQASKKRLILGDSVLSIETLWKERAGEYRELFPMSWRLTTSAETTLIDMKQRPASSEPAEFSALSPELKDLMGKVVEEKSSILLFGARKGLAPTTLCEDCSSVLSCKNCRAPVVLYSEGASRVYICHACRARRPADTTCDTCRSWRLSAMGIGIDRVKAEVTKLFPHVPIFVLDKNHAPTDLKAKKIAREFKDRGGILIGTELALFHVDKVPYSALVSVDALFSIPDFGINERVFYLASRLREISTKQTLIQTRNIGKQILAWSASGNILDFYKDEIKDRESLLYPPFSVFIKITSPVKGAPEDMLRLKESFREWSPDIIGSSLVLRLTRSEWPDPELIQALSLLSPAFLIKVDPESIL